MPPAVAGAAILGGATVYSANRASKAAKEQAAIARQGLDLATQPRRTQYGSFVDPTGSLSRFIDPISGQLNLTPQPATSGVGGGFGGFLRRNLPIQPPAIGTTFIDPGIREMRERSLANIPTYQGILAPQLTSTLSGLGQTRGRLEDLYGQFNDNAFLDPLLQRLALQRGELVRGLTNRGLGGSSFYSQALGGFEGAAAPGIAAARQQGLQARQGLLGQLADTDVQALGAAGQGVSQLQNLDNVYASVAGQNLQQELAALGLSQADIGAILDASQQIGQAGQLQNAAVGRALDVFGRALPMLTGGSYQQPPASPYAFGYPTIYDR